jgi:hypothetical protein
MTMFNCTTWDFFSNQRKKFNSSSEGFDMNIREIRGLLLIIALTTAITGLQAGEIRFAEPILLTSCGQGPDVLMMKVMLTRDSLRFEYIPLASAENLPGKGSLVLVLGGSSKGLGAAKISDADETVRVVALLEAARKDSLPVLAVHLGGLNRRGALSDPFNRLGAEGADHLIVVKSGNRDEFFSTIAAERKIPLDTLDTALKVGALVKDFYRIKP